MSEDIGFIETAADLAKSSGIKNYLWLYFLIVPLAASTASAVAVMIAALQGLGSNELAPRIYALTLMLSVKVVGSIAAAYAIGLLLSFVSFFMFGSRRARLEHMEEEAARDLASYRSKHWLERVSDENRRDREASDRLGEQRFMLAAQVRRIARQQQLMVGVTVGYTLMVLLGVWVIFLRTDAGDLWNLLGSLAKGGVSTALEPENAISPSLLLDGNGKSP